MNDNEQAPKELGDLEGIFAGLTDTERLDKAEAMAVHLEAMNQAIKAREMDASTGTAIWVDSASFVLRMIVEGRRTE